MPFQLDEWSLAAERGRRVAAAMVAENPEARARVESVYGVEYCKRRYPEAYLPSLAKDWTKTSLNVLRNLAFLR